jgi:hypothetical protein
MDNRIRRWELDACEAVCDLIEEKIGTNNPHLAKVRKAIRKAIKDEGKEEKKAKGVAK